MSEPIRFDYESKTIQVLVNLQEKGVLNLEPGFQRNSVWKVTDRRKLIESITQGYPIPSIFLYRREEDGEPVYDVIDGKQRLETIFMFAKARGFRGQGFDALVDVDTDGDREWHDWRSLRREGAAGRFLAYRIQTVEVAGDLADIVDLFVRINSTGKALTSAEKRRARFYTSPFLKESERLARRLRTTFVTLDVLGQAQIDRMRDVELVSELLASIVNEGPINKKAAIDRVISNEAVNARTLKRASVELTKSVRLLRRLLPNLRETGFSNVTEFYSLCLVIWQLMRDKQVLSDRRRNRLAQAIWVRFSHDVDEVSDVRKKGKQVPERLRLADEYLQTTKHATDTSDQRRRRGEILRGLVDGLFERKDDKRLFGPVMRRLLWHSEAKKSCSQCGKPLRWDNFQADHVLAHAKGGRTDLGNAALICRTCNPRKGSKAGKRRVHRARKKA